MLRVVVKRVTSYRRQTKWGQEISWNCDDLQHLNLIKLPQQHIATMWLSPQAQNIACYRTMKMMYLNSIDIMRNVSTIG